MLCKKIGEPGIIPINLYKVKTGQNLWKWGTFGPYDQQGFLENWMKITKIIKLRGKLVHKNTVKKVGQNEEKVEQQESKIVPPLSIVSNAHTSYIYLLWYCEPSFRQYPSAVWYNILKWTEIQHCMHGQIVADPKQPVIHDWCCLYTCRTVIGQFMCSTGRASFDHRKATIWTLFYYVRLLTWLSNV